VIDTIAVKAICNHAEVNTPYAQYDDKVILDSGASANMSGNSSLFLNKVRYVVPVILADGGISYSTHKGTIQLQVYDKKTRSFVILPLENTLLVPGFPKTLWSVNAFTQQGHQFTFGSTRVVLTLNKGKSNEQKIIIPPPFSNGSTQANVALVTTHQDIETYLNQFHLTAYWYEKRQVMRQLQEFLLQGSTYSPAALKSSGFHPWKPHYNNFRQIREQWPLLSVQAIKKFFLQYDVFLLQSRLFKRNLVFMFMKTHMTRRL